MVKGQGDRRTAAIVDLARERAERPRPDREPVTGEAELFFFLGVRYERRSAAGATR